MTPFNTQLLMNKVPDLSSPAFNWQDKNILIVEDDYAGYLLLHEILSSSHAGIIRAVTMQEAFDMLSEGPAFNLMIINTAIQGNENCRSVKRARLLWPYIRIIAISNGTCMARHGNCLPAGCDAVIGTHIDSEELMDVVYEMFYPVN
jgi:CheY-like chemotaxis protein